MDEPLVWYEGSGTTDRRFLSSDERGSIVSVTNSTGTLIGINRYDEYGQPQGTNLGVFGYTGQAWVPSLGAWYYKARVYEPELGRFLQPDPIGYSDGPNLYAYVLNDPINWVDPLGLCPVPPDKEDESAKNPADGSGGGGGAGAGGTGEGCSDNPGDVIVVTGKRVGATVVVTVNFSAKLVGYGGRLGYFGVTASPNTLSGKKPKPPEPPQPPKYDAITLDTTWDDLSIYLRSQATERVTQAAKGRESIAKHIGKFLKALHGIE